MDTSHFLKVFWDYKIKLAYLTLVQGFSRLLAWSLRLSDDYYRRLWPWHIQALPTFLEDSMSFFNRALQGGLSSRLILPGVGALIGPCSV